MTIQFTQLMKRCRGQRPEILRSIAPALVPALNRAPRHGSCPNHGGKDGFRFFKDYKETGGAICNTCGPFPTGFRLLEYHHGWSRWKVYQEVERILTQLPPNEAEWSTEQGGESAEWDQGKMDAIADLLDKSISLDDPAAEPARRYLANRGLSLGEYPAALCFHPKLESPPKTLFPATDLLRGWKAENGSQRVRGR
jgi:putative DNA primase/helicase